MNDNSVKVYLIIGIISDGICMQNRLNLSFNIRLCTFCGIRKHKSIQKYVITVIDFCSCVYSGEFSVIGDKKCIILYHELYCDLAGLVKEDNVSVRQPTGFLNLKTRTVIRKRIVVDESKRKEYEYFTESIRQLGMKDGMEIVPVIYSQSEDIEYPIPTPVIGIYIMGYKFCLKCTMVY